MRRFSELWEILFSFPSEEWVEGLRELPGHHSGLQIWQCPLLSGFPLLCGQRPDPSDVQRLLPPSRGQLMLNTSLGHVSCKANQVSHIYVVYHASLAFQAKRVYAALEDCFIYFSTRLWASAIAAYCSITWSSPLSNSRNRIGLSISGAAPSICQQTYLEIFQTARELPNIEMHTHINAKALGDHSVPLPIFSKDSLMNNQTICHSCLCSHTLWLCKAEFGSCGSVIGLLVPVFKFSWRLRSSISCVNVSPS